MQAKSPWTLVYGMLALAAYFAAGAMPREVAGTFLVGLVLTVLISSILCLVWYRRQPEG